MLFFFFVDVNYCGKNKSNKISLMHPERLHFSVSGAVTRYIVASTLHPDEDSRVWIFPWLKYFFFTWLQYYSLNKTCFEPLYLL